MNNKKLIESLRCVPDFPQKGIMFRDVTTLFKNPECLQIMEEELYEMYKDKGFANPALVIDCNHSNSNKKYMEQIRIAKEIMHNRKHSNDLKGFVKGLMIESYIEGGNQKVDEHIYGKSITDPCLGWDDTEKLLHIIAEEA